MLSVRTNVASLNAQKNMINTQKLLDKSLQRLSSGFRINNSSDDPAGLAVSENMKAQIRTLQQAERNANDGISLLQVAEGSMSEITDTLVRMRELAIESSNGTFNDDQRSLIQAEVAQHKLEIDRLANETEFNENILLNGANASFDLQVGFDQGDFITATMGDMRLANFGASTTNPVGVDLSTLDISTQTGAQDALAVIDAGLNALTRSRADLGAVQSRLNTTVLNIRSMHEQLSAANSRIRDTDVAEETANLTKNSILMQAGVSVLAQANQVPTMTLSLLS